MSIRQIKREPNTEAIEALEELMREAKSGNLQDFVLVGNMSNEGKFFRSSVFADRWRLLGALEYAKDAVQKG